jgi:tRNA A37 threonylcarbamoyladenosine dehydratase
MDLILKIFGTNSYMPGLFGLYAAETVIRYLLKKSKYLKVIHEQ